MDKNMYAAYGFLPNNNNPESQSDQFFVIQDDGTFVLNRQVQYVTEVQDVNEGMGEAQACAVYDVNPQQFFVDVANNPGALISADNFIMPAPDLSEAVHNIYGNNYLLQTLEAEATVQGEADKDMTITVQFKESEDPEEVDVVNILNKQDNTCTEITLSDEQYTMLEKKGWVFLENNGKIFILDAYGLHEVTTNESLIQNLKDATKIDLPSEIDSSSLVKDIETYPFPVVENMLSTNTKLEQKTVDTLKQEKSEDDKEDVQERKIEIDKREETKEKQTAKETPNNTRENLKESRSQLDMQKYQNTKIKILTKYNFKDIPDKIVLGRTRNGKKIVAKVVKRSIFERQFENSDEVNREDSSVEPANTNIEEASIQKKSSTKGTDIDDPEFESLVERALRGEIESGSNEVLEASDIITQLFHVPEFSCSVAGRNIVITRVTEKILLGRNHRSISFVTGIVKSNENNSCELIFIHVPHLLNKLTNEYEEYFYKQSSRSVLKPIAEKVPDCKILQVHIAETKHNGVQAISFILSERSLPCIKRKFPRRVTRLHACSACAAIFQSEAALSGHQAEHNHAMEPEGALTIDTDKLPKDDQESYTILENRFYIVKSNKGTEYCCFQCTKRFNKQANCTRHMRVVHQYAAIAKPTKTANACSVDPVENTDNDKLKDAPYKCKMCLCAYHHPASLSKHINKAHIVDKVKNMVNTMSHT